MRRALHICGILPQNHDTKSNHEKNHQTQIEGNYTKYLTNTPQNCQGHQQQGKPTKLTDQRRQNRLTLLINDKNK